MNNPVPKYLDHPEKSVRFLEWTAIRVLSFNKAYKLMNRAYPKYEGHYGYWQESFANECQKKPNNPKQKLFLKVINGKMISLTDVYTELKKLTKPKDLGNALKDVKQKTAQKAYAKEQHGDTFVSNDALVSAVKFAANDMAFKNVTHKEVVTKIKALVDLYSPSKQLFDEHISTLVGICQRRIDKFEALANVEAAIIDQGDKALWYIWGKIRRHYLVNDTIVMSQDEWKAFASVGKEKVPPLLTTLTKLGAMKLLQKGRRGSSTGRASKYKRLI